MRDEHGPNDELRHREGGRRRDHGHRSKHDKKEFLDHPKSAQTFRRGRAVAFLDKLRVNRETLQRQLNDPQFESIKEVISGELKATEMIIDDFIHMFQLHELSSEEPKTGDHEVKSSQKEV